MLAGGISKLLGSIWPILLGSGVAVFGTLMAMIGYWKRRATTSSAQNVTLKQEVAHDDHVQAVQAMDPDQVAAAIDQLTDPKPGDGSGSGTSGTSGS